VETSKPRESGPCLHPRKYPNELRERALRLVAEAMAEDPELSLKGAVHRIGPRVGIFPDTLRGCAKKARVDAGLQPGTTTSDAARLKELEPEIKELRRANEILLAASRFFAREIDPRLPW
jgi:transposase